jgi:hypothetical protein
MAERLKKFNEIREPDVRWAYFKCRPKGEEHYRPTELRDLSNAAAAVTLNSAVPDAVRDQFVMAQHLYVYSWFCYPMNMPASLWASICVEMALRLKFEDEKTSLSKLFRRAVATGLLSEGDGNRCDAVRELRNIVAHGSSMLHNDGLMFLTFSAKIINQLFPEISSG